MILTDSVPHSRPTLDDADAEALARVCRSGMIARGAETAALEAECAEYLGFATGVATASGTSALASALRALEVGPGDEVVLPTYVCRAVWDAIERVGATPTLCDVGDDWCMNPETVAPVVTPRTRAIVVVHTFGINANAASFKRFGTPIVEDCCHAVGAPGTGRAGDISIVSFHATKLLTTGEGGMALAHDSALAGRLRRIVAMGREQMSDIQAALGRSQLSRYDAFLRKRHEIADRYFDTLAGLGVALPAPVRERSIFFRFPLRMEGDFDALRARFAREGVQVRRGVDALLHRMSGQDAAAFAGAERCFAQTLSVPIYPSLDTEQCERVIRACRRVFAAGGEVWHQ